VLDLADEHMVGWQHWAYWNQDPCCARDHEGLIRALDRPPEGDNVKADKLAALARPYPRAVAGTPLRWSWKDGVFEAAWSTARAGGGRLRRGLATEIELPPAAFPAGFHMSIDGGTVRTPRGTRVLTTLRVVANRGAREVSVRVVRR
jgi:endoglycosylceramidase